MDDPVNFDIGKLIKYIAIYFLHAEFVPRT
jgi:hypothetical protein